MLVIVPVLLSMSLSAILLFPKLAASTWESGSHIVVGDARPASHGDARRLLASLLRLFALALPVIGSGADGPAARALDRGARRGAGARAGRAPAVVLASPPRRLAALLAWAWWPSGQYQPVRADRQRHAA